MTVAPSRAALSVMTVALVGVLISIILVMAYDLTHPNVGRYAHDAEGREIFFTFIIVALLAIVFGVSLTFVIFRKRQQRPRVRDR